jgi:branched-chain amino acid transport system substrate-binding protein
MKKLTLLTLFAVFFWIFGIISFAVAEEGVTDTEIHLGQWGPQTGPAAAWGSLQRGTDAYFKMINANGGIHGRKIVYHMFDDGYNPAKTKAGVKELQEGVGIFAWASGVGTAPGLAVKKYLMDRKVPWVGPAAGSSHWVNPPQKYLFGVYPLYSLEAKVLTDYAINTLRKKRIAIAYLNDDYGKGGLDGAIEALEKRGLKLVAKVPVELKDTDMKPHVMKLKKSKAEVVLLWTNVSNAIRIIGVSKAMRFAPQFMSTSTCSDFPLMMHISKGLWEDVITASFSELPDGNNALLKKYKKEVYKKYAAKTERWGIFYYGGILFTEPLVEAMKQCGRNLTRERLVKKLEGLKNFKGIGPVVSYKRFDPKDPMCRQGSKATFLVKCMKGGKSNRLTDWISME